MDDGARDYFPARGLDPRPDLHSFLAEWYGGALARLHEQPLYPANAEQPRLVVRLLCLPTWSRACSVRVEASGCFFGLEGRELDGEEAGFELGQLARRQARTLSGTETARFTASWEQLRFWSLAASRDNDVLDGTTYVLEAAERGRYHVAQWNDFEWGDPFGELSDLLFRLAGFARR